MSQPREIPTTRSSRRNVETADWVGPPPESEGFPYYLATLRANLWLILTTTAVCVGAAFVFVTLSPKVYESAADLLITPISQDNESLVGLGLPTDSGDPTRDVETISRVIKTEAVARRVIKTLSLDQTPAGLLATIAATPVASSNIIAVSARGDSAKEAAQIANAFARASVADRTARLHQRLDVVIPRLRKEIAQLGPKEDVAREALLQRLRDLETLRALSDPTVRLETLAEANPTPVSPRPTLSIAAAVIAGLLIGAAVVLGSQLLDPRLRREEQLRRYRIPILSRVPLERTRRRRAHSPLLPTAASPAMHDAYLLLGATLASNDDELGLKRSVLVTGPDSGDGKSTSALNLAAAISMNESVVLVEADSRRPTLARVLGVMPFAGLSSVLTGKTSLGNALVSAGRQAPDVRLLVQLPTEPPLSSVMNAASAERLVSESHQFVDWVVIDAPPLALVPDALPLAHEVDSVILVVRLGNTRLKALEELAGLLVQQGLTPRGFVLVGGRRQASYYGA